MSSKILNSIVTFLFALKEIGLLSERKKKKSGYYRKKLGYYIKENSSLCPVRIESRTFFMKEWVTLPLNYSEHHTAYL